MVFKKAKKGIKQMGEVSMTGAGMAIGLGAIGGTSAAHGQAGLAGATSMMGATGTVIGSSMLISTVDKAFNKKKKKR